MSASQTLIQVKKKQSALHQQQNRPKESKKDK